MDITGSSAIVTGGASGIGAAVARALAAKGAVVVVADLNAEKGEALAAEIGGVFASVDVTKTEQVAAAVEAAAEIAPLRACDVAVVQATSDDRDVQAAVRQVAEAVFAA